LAAARQLQSLELHSCQVPAEVVAELVATLGCSSPQDHPAGHDDVSISHPSRMMGHAGAAGAVGRFSGGASPVSLAGLACPSKGDVMQSGSLTSLVFTQQ
jgi:hypothetical protein